MDLSESPPELADACGGLNTAQDAPRGGKPC